jgi:hypothetical protein
MAAVEDGDRYHWDPYPHVSVRGTAAPGRETCEEHGAWVYKTSPRGTARPLHPYCCDKDLCMTWEPPVYHGFLGDPPAWTRPNRLNLRHRRPKFLGSLGGLGTLAAVSGEFTTPQPTATKQKTWEHRRDEGSSFHTECIFSYSWVQVIADWPGKNSPELPNSPASPPKRLHCGWCQL